MVLQKKGKGFYRALYYNVVEENIKLRDRISALENTVQMYESKVADLASENEDLRDRLSKTQTANI